MVITPGQKALGRNIAGINKPISGKGAERLVESHFIGIDVFKAKLNATLRPSNESFGVCNSQRGIAALIKQLKELSVSRVVLEASGVMKSRQPVNWPRRVCR